jgi:hypothetical protein
MDARHPVFNRDARDEMVSNVTYVGESSVNFLEPPEVSCEKGLG